MHTASQIAKFLLGLANQNGDTITNLKLQKLLYYAQAWYLVNNSNNKLFSDDIEAWLYGPVVPEVYNEYQSFGRSPITIEVSIQNDFPDICQHVRQFLQEFSETFFGFSATELVGMTHQELPWNEAVKNGYHTKINTDTMFRFYTEMLNNGDE